MKSQGAGETEDGGESEKVGAGVGAGVFFLKRLLLQRA